MSRCINTQKMCYFLNVLSSIGTRGIPWELTYKLKYLTLLLSVQPISTCMYAAVCTCSIVTTLNSAIKLRVDCIYLHFFCAKVIKSAIEVKSLPVHCFFRRRPTRDTTRLENYTRGGSAPRKNPHDTSFRRSIIVDAQSILFVFADCKWEWWDDVGYTTVLWGFVTWALLSHGK
jgi:hypothetical protein